MAPLLLPLNDDGDGLGAPELAPDAPVEATVLETVLPPAVLDTVTPKGVVELVRAGEVEDPPLEPDEEDEEVDDDEEDELEGGGAMLNSPV